MNFTLASAGVQLPHRETKMTDRGPDGLLTSLTPRPLSLFDDRPIAVLLMSSLFSSFGALLLLLQLASSTTHIPVLLVLFL